MWRSLWNGLRVINIVNLKKIFIEIGGAKSNAIFSNMLLLATGEGIGKLIGIISLPLITRIYSPENIGVLSIYNSIVMILLPFGTFKYSDAIILPKTDGYALNVSVLGFMINIVFSFLTFVILWLFGIELFTIFGITNITMYWWLIGISVFFINSYEILYNWNLRKGNYKLMAKTKSLQNVTGESAKIILGLFGIKPLGLLMGAVFARSGGLLTLYSQYKKDWRINSSQLRFSRIKFLFCHYKDFPAYRLASYFLFILSTQSIPIIVASLYGTSMTGQVGLAITVIAVPITLIGNSVGQAYYREISKIKNYKTNELFDVTLSVAKKLLMLSVLPFLVVLFLARPIFILCFGKEWESAGEFCSILSFFLVTQFIASPLMNVLVVLKKQSMTIFIHAFRLLSIFVIYYISNLLGFKIKTFLLIYSVFLSLHYIFVVMRLFNLMKNERIKKIN